MFNFIKKNALWVRIGAGVALVAGVVLIVIACIPTGKTFKKVLNEEVDEVEFKLDYEWSFKKDKVVVTLNYAENIMDDDTVVIEKGTSVLGEYVGGLTQLKVLSGIIENSQGQITSLQAAGQFLTSKVQAQDQTYVAYFNAIQSAFAADKLECEYKIENGEIMIKCAALGLNDWQMFGKAVGPVVGSVDLFKFLDSVAENNGDMTKGVQEAVILTNGGAIAELAVGAVLAIVALVAESFVCVAVYKKKD